MKTTEIKSTALYIITYLDKANSYNGNEAKLSVYRTKNAKRVDQFVSAMKKRFDCANKRASIIKIENGGVTVEVIDEAYVCNDHYHMDNAGNVKTILESRYGYEYLDDDPRFIRNRYKVHSA